MNVMLEDDDLVEVLSADEVYIGNIDSDDYETADFDVYIKDNNETTVMLPVYYEYMDAVNHVYSQDINLEIHMCQEGDKSGACSNGGDNTVGIIIGVVVLLAIIGLVVRAVLKRHKK